MDDAPPVLALRNLRKDRSRGREDAYSLRIPRLDVRQGEKLLIAGPSGAGKSTLLDIIGLILRPDRAESFVLRPQRAGADGPYACEGPGMLDAAAAWRQGRVEELARWRRGIGYVLQTGGLLPFVTVRENIALGRELRGLGRGPGASPATGQAPGQTTGQTAGRVEELAAELGIGHLLGAYPAALSVGERQRAAIAGALAAEPFLVLADEPTAALDPRHAALVLDLFCRLVDRAGLTLIMVSHAPEQVRGMGFRTLRVAAADSEGHNGMGGGMVMELAEKERP